MPTIKLIGYSKALWCRHVDYELLHRVKVEFTLLKNDNMQLRVLDAQTHASTQTGLFFVSLSDWTANTCCLNGLEITANQAAEWALSKCQWCAI